ncbi:sensor histidine kinase [Chitinophaga rhizosphaerae]|uniref:sensor histidine kinase n=1 Tax=Chitinophaga rhizosphaerae TaxID=1864947 RepID=UPI000F80F7B1|nr:histidine kinase [Chitinophaga rhizosphaerae]
MKIRYLYWIAQILGWGLFTYLWNNIRIDGFGLRGDVFTDYDFYFHIANGVVCTHLLDVFIRWQKLERMRFGAVFTKLWLAVLGVSILMVVNLAIMAIWESGGWNAFISPVTKQHDLSPTTMMVIIFIIAVFLWHLLLWGWVAIYFALSQGRVKRQELESQNRLKQAELDNLKTRLNPHFLFNSLSSIRSLIAENPERAQQAVGELAEVLRSAMLSEHQQLIRFGRELEVVKHYLAIEKIRFEERLQVEFNIGDGSDEQTIPPMLLQTLVENAIKHGISKRSAGGDIRISAVRSGKHFIIQVDNSGRMENTASEEGFGINGTIRRLALLYGGEAKFHICNLENDTVRATVKIPAA